MYIEKIWKTLQDKGLVETQEQFLTEWCGVCEGYIRQARRLKTTDFNQALVPLHYRLKELDPVLAMEVDQEIRATIYRRNKVKLDKAAKKEKK